MFIKDASLKKCYSVFQKTASLVPGVVHEKPTAIAEVRELEPMIAYDNSEDK